MTIRNWIASRALSAVHGAAWVVAWLVGAFSLHGVVQAQGTAAVDHLDLSEISFISGGIGAEEAEAMKAQASAYALALIFAQHQHGQDVYLASVPVVIRTADDGATVLNTVTEGPYLLVNLPEGRYRVSAVYQQDEKTAEVQVRAGGHQRHTFIWQGPAADSVAAVPAASLPAATEPVVSSPGSVLATAEPAQVIETVTPGSHLPVMKTWGEVSYLTGGIGSDESRAIRAELGKHPLSITLAARSEGKDVFVAAVPVVIRDAGGKVILEVTSEGPYLLADLPPGRYQVTAIYRGEEKRAQAEVAAGKPARLTFVWHSGA